MPSLTIVGLGPARPDHLTLEASRLLSGAAGGGLRAYGLAHARDVTRAIAPELEVRSLDYLYQLDGVDRPAAYGDLAQLLVRRAFEDGFDVLYLVAGSPLFYNDAVLAIRHLCAQRELPVRLVHGMSFVDLVLDKVYWTGHHGLQLYSAWNVARDGVVLATDAPALLCQLGEFTRGGDALNPAGSTAMLDELRDTLVARYGPAHPVIILYSSGFPDYDSLARRVRLDELAEAEVPVYSNLWVPGLDGPAVEMEAAP